MRTGLVLALSFVLAIAVGCADDAPPPEPVDNAKIAEALAAQPEIDHVIERTTQWPGYRYFEIWFRQPIDHAHPDAGTFLQYATLIHHDVVAPTVLLHTGYGNWYYDYPGEVVRMLHGNQLAIEHRFFRTSRPSGAAAWAHLDIEQSAADHHVIATVLHRIYRGSFVETGASKGGMTSIYHRRFWPDDVDATIAYVAPISFAAPDYRYEPYLEAIGPTDCRAALRAVQAEMLRNRRAALEARAATEAVDQGRSYSRISLAAAVESAVVSLEWAFWQYAGVGHCPDVPPVTASDDALFAFLQDINEVGSSDDAGLAEFEAYYYQAEDQLGYPGTMDEHLDGLVTFPPAAYDGTYPVGVTKPSYQAAVMTDVDAWVKSDGERIVFIYGQWDPWTGGSFDAGSRPEVVRVVAPMATHGAGVGALAGPDRDLVLSKLAAWTGVTPDTAELRKAVAPIAAPRPPRPLTRR